MTVSAIGWSHKAFEAWHHKFDEREKTLPEEGLPGTPSAATLVQRIESLGKNIDAIEEKNRHRTARGLHTVAAVTMLVAFGACDAVGKKLTSTSVTNNTIGVKLKYDRSWEAEGLGASLVDAHHIILMKEHPSNAAITSVDVTVLSGGFESLRAAYKQEYSDRDRALVSAAHEAPPTFEDVVLYGVPALSRLCRSTRRTPTISARPVAKFRCLVAGSRF